MQGQETLQVVTESKGTAKSTGYKAANTESVPNMS